MTLDGRPTRAGAAIEEHRLENGLRVLILERHLDPVVAVMVWYPVGSRNEREDEAGASHFLEHMMFKGSERYGKGEVDLVTTRLGGNNNAFTTPDHTAYWFELASDRWEIALEIEADRMAHLTLDESEFEAEKAVVLEELAMGLDDPWRSLTHQVQESLFTRHPYRRPVIGYADVLHDMPVERIRDYYRRFYHPGNALLVLAGDVTPRQALRLARDHFGSIEPGPAYDRSDRRRPPFEEPLGERRLVTRWDDGAARLCMAWPTVPVGSDDDFVLDVASTVLAGGRLSRLHRSLVLERGLAASIATNNDTRREGGSFWLFAEGVEGVDPAELEQAVSEEIDALAERPLAAAELRQAKRILAAGDAYEGETVTDLAEEVGEYAVDGDWRLAIEAGERRARVRASAVRDVARRLLSRERRVVGWSLPGAFRGRRQA